MSSEALTDHDRGRPVQGDSARPGGPVMIEVWKSISMTLAATLVTGLASWLSFGSSRVSRPDMEGYVQAHSPWTRERQAVNDTLRRMAEVSDRLAAQLQQQALDSARLSTKLDGILIELATMRGDMRRLEAAASGKPPAAPEKPEKRP